MSMIGFVRQISPIELANLRRDPGRIWELMRSENCERFPPNVRPLMERMQALILGGHRDSADMAELQSQMQREMGRPDALRILIVHRLVSRAKALIGIKDRSALSLEKSWHVLHYLLTGAAGKAAPPLGNAILGGKEIGDDVGYGPVRFLGDGRGSRRGSGFRESAP